MKGLTPTRRLTTVAVICLCLTWVSSDSRADDQPRMNVVAYFDVSNGESASHFVGFKNMMLHQTGALGDQIIGFLRKNTESKSFKYLESMNLEFRNNDNAPGNSIALKKAWNAPQMLQIWNGSITEEAGTHIVVTYVFLGGVKGELPSPRLGLEQEVSTSLNRSVKNSHMAAMAYAVAIDLRENGYSNDTVLDVLSEAEIRAKELNPEVPGHKALNDAIASSIAIARSMKELGQ